MTARFYVHGHWAAFCYSFWGEEEAVSTQPIRQRLHMGFQASNSFDGWFEPVIESPIPDAVGGNKVNVFCFPFSGSGVAMFGGWRRHEIPENASLYAARLPGREDRLRETPREDLVVLAGELASCIRSNTIPSQPICLLGFSMGALLAFEVARGLRRLGLLPSLLVAGSSRAPQGKWARGKIHLMPDAKFVKKMDSRYGAVPQAVKQNKEMMALLLPMLRADIKMFETYRYRDEPPLECEILTLLGTEDRKVKPKHIYPWRQLGRTFRHRSFQGDHYFVRQHEDAVLKLVFSRLARRTR